MYKTKKIQQALPWPCGKKPVSALVVHETHNDVTVQTKWSIFWRNEDTQTNKMVQIHKFI